MNYLKFLFTALFLFSSGCAQKEKKVEEHLQNGNVDEALVLATSISAKEPKNTVRLVLLRKSRTKWMEKKLIDVRLLRLAGSQHESEQLLNKILSSQKDWQVFPIGAVFSTQKEEIESRTRTNKSLISIAIKEGHPVLAHVIYQRSQDLFTLTSLDEAEKIKTQIKSSGQEFCSRTAGQISEIQFYYKTFLKKTCALWGANFTDHKTKNSVTLFSKIEPEFNANSLNVGQIEVFTKNLDNAFEQSLWFDQKSNKSLPLKVSGEFYNTIEEKIEDKRQTYMEQVPYEEASIVPKGVQEKRDAQNSITTVGALIFNIVLQLITGPETEERVEDNNDGTVTVYRKRYRSEPRIFSYKATKVTQDMGIDLNVKIPVSTEPLQFDFKGRQHHESYEHGINAPEMDLTPMSRQIVTTDEWLAGQALALNTRLNEELKAVWENSFCKSQFVVITTPVEVEGVHRCAYGLNGSIPAFVESWFQGTLGVSFTDWRNARAI